MNARSETSKIPRLATLAAISLFGCALRVAAARGDYWLDEAWSALFAHEAGTAARVLFAINHDNNHFLNTLWLLLVGWGSPPLLGRSLSILCGTLAIPVAWSIGARRGIRPAIVTALLFALSPILVTYGSEARGYAPMLLALLAGIWLVDRELNGDAVRHGGLWLGLATLSGMLAHVTMLFGVTALTLWVFIQSWRQSGSRPAAVATARLMGRSIAAAAAVLLIIAVGAGAAPDGYRMGSSAAFAWPAFLDALAHMIAFTIGWPFRIGFWLLPALLVPAVMAIRGRALFYFVAIIGLPVLVATVQPDNAAIPRYYLLSATALLLLLADLMAGRRRPAWLPLAAFTIGSLIVDVRIIANLRGQPGEAISAIAERSGSAVVIADEQKDVAVLAAAAAVRGYRLGIVENCTSGARYLFAENNGTVALPPVRQRCGLTWRAIRAGRAYGLSGSSWRLYERSS